MAHAIGILLDQYDLFFCQTVQDLHVMAGEKKLGPLWVQVGIRKKIQLVRDQMRVHVGFHLINHLMQIG